MHTIPKADIEASIDPKKVIQLIEEGFCLLHKGQAVVPPFGSIQFTEPPGEAHIKYGYLQTGDFFVVKIASSFYDNPKQNLASCQGLMAIFCKKTGKALAILQDDGLLTEHRTAAAGAVAAKYLAPKKIQTIGIVGTGAQAYFQLSYLSHVTDCKNVIVWGRSKEKAIRLCGRFPDYNMVATDDIAYLAKQARLIVTTTSSRTPLLQADHIKPGTHITAIGADDLGKQELDPKLLLKADRVVVDSLDPAFKYGECQHVNGLENVLELGDCILNAEYARQDDQEITISDLTGVAVQDIQIAQHVYKLNK